MIERVIGRTIRAKSHRSSPEEKLRFKGILNNLKARINSSQLIKNTDENLPTVEPMERLKIDFNVSSYGKVILSDGTYEWGGDNRVKRLSEDSSEFPKAGDVISHYVGGEERKKRLLDKENQYDPYIFFYTSLIDDLHSTIDIRSEIIENEEVYFDKFGLDSSPNPRRDFRQITSVNSIGSKKTPYQYTGYDIFSTLNPPTLYLFNEEVIKKEVKQNLTRFNLKSVGKEMSRDSITEHFELPASLGFPENYYDSDKYIDLATRILAILSKDTKAKILIKGGFENFDSNYLGAIKKLDFIRFLLDLRGQWFSFATAPILGEYQPLPNVTFIDSMFSNIEPRTRDKKPIVLDFSKGLELIEPESRVKNVIITGLAEKLAKPIDIYKTLQSKINF